MPRWCGVWSKPSSLPVIFWVGNLSFLAVLPQKCIPWGREPARAEETQLLGQQSQWNLLWKKCWMTTEQCCLCGALSDKCHELVCHSYSSSWYRVKRGARWQTCIEKEVNAMLMPCDRQFASSCWGAVEAWNSWFLLLPFLAVLWKTSTQCCQWD